jgi:MFS family permease
MLAETTGNILQSTAVMFLLGFALLFLIYYFTSPVYTEYGDRKSRLFYSFINAFFFSLVLAILFVLLPRLSDAYGVLPSLAAGLALILISTFAQVYAIALLVKSGFLKMRRKRRAK